MPLDAGNWIALVSAVMALLSLWNAFAARRIAKRSLALAVAARDATKPSLDLYIDRVYSRRLASPARRVFVFRIVVTNRSDAPNAIKVSRLRIEHRRANGPVSRLDLEADASCGPDLGISIEDTLRVPVSVQQRAVVAGFIFFSVASALLADTTIEAYTVSVIDTFDKESQKEVLLLSEQHHEQVEEATNRDK